jgi:hypothetical protein
MKERPQPCNLRHLPLQPARGVRVYVIFTMQMYVLATAYHRPVSKKPREKSRSAGSTGAVSCWSRPGTW